MFDRYVAATEPSWTRRALIIASISLHVGAGIALAIYSIFHVEEIAPPAVSLTFFSAPPPPPPPPPPAHKKSVQTEKKIIPQNIVQPTKVTIVQPKQEEKKQEKEDDDGEEGGVEGGVKGGVQGGTVGGVQGGTIGGTGTDLNAKPSPRMVAAFTLAAQQLSHPDPRLPDEFKSSHPQQTVKGMYKVCIGTNGHISDVTPLTSIPGVDKTIIEQIRAGWTYKPQPVPVCTASVIVFKIN
jgi:protein TonB